jgi:hypothetical protein
MNLLDLVSNHTNLRKSGSRYVGPCPKCGGSSTTDRFSVNTAKGFFHCFSCGFNGDAIKWLREIEGASCPDAHERLGLTCENTGCPAWEKCRLGNGGNKSNRKASPSVQPVQPPAPPEPEQYHPASANTPQQQWAQQAAPLIEKAHHTLLQNQDQLNYLHQRGIPSAAIEWGKLGYLPENRYPKRETWGLPTELKENGKPKKMFIPSGILIPFFDADTPHRIRIRRENPRQQDSRYYWVQGSGDDVPVIGPAKARAVVVIESDLDAFMVRWQCRDLDIAVIPLGTCSAKPKQTAMRTLQNAQVILLAHDFEPRVNPRTGQHENPGGQGAKWWLNTFPGAKRWPVPAGKDAGDYYKDHNGDIRAWILAGLPPAFHVQKEETPAQPAPKPQDQPLPANIVMRTKSGYFLGIVNTQEEKQPFAIQSGYNTVTREEVKTLARMDEAQRNHWLNQNGLKLFGLDVAEEADIINTTANIFDGVIYKNGPDTQTTEQPK